ERVSDFGAPSGKTIGWPVLDGAQVGFDDAELRGPHRLLRHRQTGWQRIEETLQKDGQLRAVRPPVLQVRVEWPEFEAASRNQRQRQLLDAVAVADVRQQLVVDLQHVIYEAIALAWDANRARIPHRPRRIGGNSPLYELGPLLVEQTKVLRK